MQQERDFIARSNELFGALAGWSFDHRWWVVAAGLGLLAGSLSLASRAQVDSSYEAYFDPRDPMPTSPTSSSARTSAPTRSPTSSTRRPIVEHGAFDLEVMRKIVLLTEALEDEVPFIYEVTSLANAELMVGRRGRHRDRALRDDFPETQAALLTLRERYLAKPMIVGGIVSEDGRYGAIIIEMDRSSTDPLESIRLDPEGGDGLDNLYPQVTDVAIQEILARPSTPASSSTTRATFP